MSDITPSQTVGPFFAHGLTPHSRCEWRPEQGKDVYNWKETAGANLVTPDASGTKIRIEGQILDGDGMPINDAMIEIWQSDAQGRWSVPGPNGKPQAPHIVFCIFSRGMLRQIYTRLYFADEAANGSDPILTLVPADRRGTLVAHKEMRGELPVYRFDIRVQGANETIFFDI